jgi:hypothetical protein
MSGNGWLTVTRRRGAKARSSNRKRETQSAKRNHKQFFQNWFDEAYPDELAMIGSVDIAATPKRRAQPLNPADKEKVQRALIELFRYGYHESIGYAPDEEILAFINDFLRQNRICISGGFILKSIGAFATGTASSSIDIDIYIPSSPNVKEIHETLQGLFGVDRKPDGKPRARHFKVQSGSRSTKGSFFAKNGIYSVTKYERTTFGNPVIQDGGNREAAQARWEKGVRTGSMLDAQRGLDMGADPNQLIGGKHPADVLLASEHPTQTLLRLILEKTDTLPGDLVRDIVALDSVSESEIFRMLQVAVNYNFDMNDARPLDLALRKNYASVIRYLLESGADVTQPSSLDPSKSILEMARIGTYPPEATAALMAYLEDPGTVVRLPTRENTFYTAFKGTEATRKRHVAMAIKEFEKNGPICSAEGSYQHKGECWNDAAHMLFFYADGLKGWTQEMVLKSNLRQLAAELHDGTPEGFARAKRMYVYLEAARSRFARQVLNQTLTDAICAADMEAAITDGYGRYRAAGTNALVAAVMGAPKMGAVGTDRPYHIGATDYVAGYFSKYILADLLKASGLSDQFKLTTIGIKYTHELLDLPEPVDKIAGLVLTSKSGKVGRDTHATCMYTCNGVDYCFDDNFGVFQYPWRKLLAMPSAKLVIVSIDPQDATKDVNYFWPAVYIEDQKKLIVPSMEPHTRYSVLSWNRVWNKTKIWKLGRLIITYEATSYIQDVSVVSFVGVRQVIPKKAPYVVGRGPYRAAYRPSNSSSERLALEGPRWLAEDEIPQIKSEMDIVQAATKSSPVQIIRSFDLTFCQNWYDGDELWSMDREAVYKRSPGTLEDSYVPIYLSGNPVTRKRILKYMQRGFRVQYADPISGAPIEITQANVNSP